ncbi:MAG: hypothetical protein EOO43_18865 [Flavobacterium sp.]|nr:MAG: hypothetical protein EOO43_18865 [Flavobacterium sp.]
MTRFTDITGKVTEYSNITCYPINKAINNIINNVQLHMFIEEFRRTMPVQAPPENTFLKLQNLKVLEDLVERYFPTSER